MEVNLSLPGQPTAQGFWPGVWTMGTSPSPRCSTHLLLIPSFETSQAISVAPATGERMTACGLIPTTSVTSEPCQTKRKFSLVEPLHAYARTDRTYPTYRWPNGTDPVAAKHSGSKDYGGELSYVRCFSRSPRLLFFF